MLQSERSARISFIRSDWKKNEFEEFEEDVLPVCPEEEADEGTECVTAIISPATAAARMNMMDSIIFEGFVIVLFPSVSAVPCSIAHCDTMFSSFRLSAE